jgi:hypothetical protein
MFNTGDVIREVETDCVGDVLLADDYICIIKMRDCFCEGEIAVTQKTMAENFELVYEFKAMPPMLKPWFADLKCFDVVQDITTGELFQVKDIGQCSVYLVRMGTKDEHAEAYTICKDRIHDEFRRYYGTTVF